MKGYSNTLFAFLICIFRDKEDQSKSNGIYSLIQTYKDKD